MHSPASERRIRTRSRIQFPVVIPASGATPESHGVTRDISQAGVYFYTEAPFRLGQVIDFKVLLPLPDQSHTRVVCRGTVIRVETPMIPALETCGVAVAITKLRLV